MGQGQSHRGRAGRRFAALTALNALLLLAGAAPNANAAWTAPIELSAPGQAAVQPRVAAGETGAVFAWQLGGPEGLAQTRVRSWPGAQSEIADLSTYGGQPGEVSFEPDVAMVDSGAAVYAWGRYMREGGAGLRVQARTRSAGGALGPIRNLSPILPGLDDVHVDADSEGNAVIVWEADVGSHHQVQARRMSADGVLGPLLELSPPGQHATRPRVGISADGTAVFTWQRLDGTSHRAEARALTGGLLEPTVVLSSSRWTSDAPQVAVNAAGVALFVWRSADPGGAGGDRIETRVRLADGSYTRRQTVADAPGEVGNPQVEIATDGAGMFAWRRSLGSERWLEARPRGGLGGLGSQQTVAAADAPQSLSSPELSVDADGNAVVAWAFFDATAAGPRCCNRVQARTVSPLGDTGATATLSGPGVASVEVAGDGGGNAAVVWSQPNGGAGRIQAAFGP